MPTLVTYGFYPLVASLTIAFAWINFTGAHDLQDAYTVFTGARFVLFIFVEMAWPCRAEWKMTWPSFLRDVKYMIAGGGMMQFVKFVVAWLAIGVAQDNAAGLASLPLLAQVLLAILAYELVQYGVHRYSHEGRGPLGRFFWRIHAVHHLPQRIYFLMHPVMHPLNILIVSAIGLIPAYVLGLNKEAVFLFNLIVSANFSAPSAATETSGT